jgi:RimJ/RimL family protein N-acetyltransferase
MNLKLAYIDRFESDIIIPQVSILGLGVNFLKSPRLILIMWSKTISPLDFEALHSRNLDLDGSSQILWWVWSHNEKWDFRWVRNQIDQNKWGFWWSVCLFDLCGLIPYSISMSQYQSLGRYFLDTIIHGTKILSGMN